MGRWWIQIVPTYFDKIELGEYVEDQLNFLQATYWVKVGCLKTKMSDPYMAYHGCQGWLYL